MSVGTCHYRCTKCNKACNVYKKLLEINPSDTDIQYSLVQGYQKLGKNDLVYAGLKKLVVLKPERASYFNELAKVCFVLKKREEAVFCQPLSYLGIQAWLRFNMP